MKLKANPHIIPFRECPLCGNIDVDLIYTEFDSTYILSCDCGLAFGHPYGYNSKLDLVTDWNIRHNELRRNF